jgi:RNA polymerase sigma-70 factor, ECF subfamily
LWAAPQPLGGTIKVEDHEHDRALLSHVARGDKGAMKRLYERHHAGLLVFVESRLRDPAEAFDVVQDTFLDVWRSASRYENRSSVKTWIFSIARNKTIDRFRKKGREVPLDEDFDPPDLSPNPHAVVEAASDAAQVNACIEKLSAAHARVVRLAFYEDLGYAEIAEIEQVPEGTFKTRIFHAKKLLMQCLTRIIRGV